MSRVRISLLSVRTGSRSAAALLYHAITVARSAPRVGSFAFVRFRATFDAVSMLANVQKLIGLIGFPGLPHGKTRLDLNGSRGVRGGDSADRFAPDPRRIAPRYLKKRNFEMIGRNPISNRYAIDATPAEVVTFIIKKKEKILS